MIPLTKNNYIRHKNSGADFQIDIDKLAVGGNYYEESILAAEEIYSIKNGKLYMLYSGGIDSEYALSVFLDLKMDITPVVINLNPGYNTFDTDYAINFCDKNKITPLVINLDFDEFVKSGKFLEVSKICRSEIYHRAATAYVAGQLDGCVLLGDGEAYIKKSESNWNVEIYEHDYAVWNYFVSKGIHGTTHFNRYTSGMMMSFLSDSRMAELANNQVPGKLSSNSSKFIMYNRHCNFKLEERPKYHGYEKIETSEIFNHDAFKELKIIGKEWNGVYSKDYFSFMKDCHG